MPPKVSAHVLRLLRDAELALWEELYAAGEEEVRSHPTLAAHARVHARIEKYLGLPKKKLP